MIAARRKNERSREIKRSASPKIKCESCPRAFSQATNGPTDAGTSFLGGSDLRDTRIRVRGLSASTAVVFFETGIAVDTYTAERLELSGGPNSILFGFGSSGGLVNIMTKRAQVARNRASLRTQVGEWNHRRFELDHNQVVLPGKIALPLNGLLQNSGGWRRWDYNDSSRGAHSLRVNPWKNTTVIANYENGQMKSHVTRPLHAFDALALWQASGSATLNDAVWTTANRATGINRNTAVKNNSFLFTGDPNTVIPDPNGGATPVTNPNARSLSLESRWVIDRGRPPTTWPAPRSRGISIPWKKIRPAQTGRHGRAGEAERLPLPGRRDSRRCRRRAHRQCRPAGKCG